MCLARLSSPIEYFGISTGGLDATCTQNACLASEFYRNVATTNYYQHLELECFWVVHECQFVYIWCNCDTRPMVI